MTLVVTTASKRGITVVGDRASAIDINGRVEFATATKVRYSPKARMAFAFWGKADFPQGQSYEKWAEDFVSSLEEGVSVKVASERLAESLNEILESMGRYWYQQRRGIHVSGYQDDLPVIYHVHTGDPNAYHHRLMAYPDVPDIQFGDLGTYRRHLETGGYVQLRNGFYELFAAFADNIYENRDELTQMLKSTFPAPSLRGQATLDETVVRMVNGLMRAAELPERVGVEIDVIAFDQHGLVDVA